jgi:hypothetical protein
MQDLSDPMPQVDQAAFELDKRTRIGRVQNQVDEINRQISAVVSQVGARVLELYRQNQLPISDLSPLCQAVLSLEGQVANLQAQIVSIQQEAMPQTALACLNCHAPVAAGANFCPNCGHSLTAAPPLKPGPVCPSCGAPTVIGVAFCGNCGYHLLASEPPSPAPPPAQAIAPADQSSQPAPASEPVAPSSAPGAPTPPPSPPAPAPLETIPPLPICPQCGTLQRRADARFCRVCGVSLAASSAPSASAGASDTPTLVPMEASEPQASSVHLPPEQPQ